MLWKAWREISMIKEEPFKVIVIDDMEPICELVKRVLNAKLKCDVTICTNFSDLEIALEKFTPDLLLVDIFMPGGKSFEPINNIVKKFKLEEKPRIYFSAHATAETRVEALESGGYDYLDKPFYPQELVTRIQLHIENARQKVRIAKELEEQRALLGVICHDIQNPISAVHTLVSFMLDHPDEDVNHVLPSLLQTTESALGLLAHVREYKKLTADQNFQTETFNVKLALDEAINVLVTMAKNKSVTIENNCSDKFEINMNRVVFVHNIICNLLSNAIKFSFANSNININVQKVFSTGNHTCQIEIEDHGLGMSEYTLENLFNPATNISKKGTESEHGSGFGMPLVKHYLDMFSGSIIVSSRSQEEDPENCGTKIQIQLPISQ